MAAKRPPPNSAKVSLICRLRPQRRGGAFFLSVPCRWWEGSSASFTQPLPARLDHAAEALLQLGHHAAHVLHRGRAGSATIAWIAACGSASLICAGRNPSITASSASSTKRGRRARPCGNSIEFAPLLGHLLQRLDDERVVVPGGPPVRGSISRFLIAGDTAAPCRWSPCRRPSSRRWSRP